MLLRSPCCWCGLRLLDRLRGLVFHSSEYDAVSLGSRFLMFETTMAGTNYPAVYPRRMEMSAILL